MGIFSKQSRAKSQHSATTLIAKGCTINGQFRLENNIQVDGKVEGQLQIAKSLIISETGEVGGELHVDHLIVNGEFSGTCYANKVEILSKGRVNAQIYCDDLCIEPGGRFNGTTHPAANHQLAELVDINSSKKTEPVSSKVKKSSEKAVLEGQQAQS